MSVCWELSKKHELTRLQLLQRRLRVHPIGIPSQPVRVARRLRQESSAGILPTIPPGRGSWETTFAGWGLAAPGGILPA